MAYDQDMPGYIQEMADWLNGEIADHQCSFASAYAGMEIMMGILRSAANGGQIAMPLGDGQDEIELIGNALSDAEVIPTPICREEYLGS